MNEFATVLRAWRDRVTPEQVGLPVGGPRRTSGLRREELALLAGVSVEYLVQLEQGRSKHPSASLLGSLARALRLTDAERDHLFRVAGVAPPAVGSVPRHITPGVRRIVDRLGDVPLSIHSAAWDVLHWNPLWAAITGDPSRLPPGERNVAWRHFVAGERVMDYDDAHAAAFSSDLAADLRAAVGRYPTDRGLTDLIARLRAASSEFDGLWSEARVAEHRTSTKTATDTPVGPITVDCDVLTVSGSDQRVVVYTAAPGSPDAEKLALLTVVGTQQLA